MTSWNRGAEKIFGHGAEEMVGASMLRLVPPEHRDEHSRLVSRIRSGESVSNLETIRQTKDGQPIEVSITAIPIRDAAGAVVGTTKIIRDISLLKRQEREIVRLSRLYTALSQVNQAIVRLPDRDELFGRVCRHLVEDGGFHLAWIGWHDAGTRQIVPVAKAGDTTDYLGSIRIFSDDRPEGSGPSATAFRSGRPSFSNDMPNDPTMQFWRPEIERRHFRAAAAFPIRLAGQPCGVLTVYADQSGFFQDKEVALLQEAADDISFALDNLAREQERARTAAAAWSEKLFSDSMIASMPGVVYFYDETGRFLRWNRNFEIVSGYSGAEIARMHPLDFFEDDAKELVRQRIAHALETGEASVEAPFRAKDGRTTLYLFTGRRVVFEGRNCLVGVGIDISERERAETALRESEAEFRTLAEAVPQIVWVARPDGSNVYFNHRWTDYTGLPRADAAGTGWVAALHPEDRESAGPGWKESVRNGGPYSLECRLRRADGVYRWWLIRGVPLQDDSGDIVKWFGTCTDIHDLKETQEQLRQSQRLEAVGQLTGGVAHDFNNILMVIMANVEMLQEEADFPAEHRDLLDRIAASGERAADLTRRLLAFSRKQRLKPQLTDVTDLVAGTDRLLRRTLGEQIEIETVFADEPWITNIDRAQLEAALVNLCVNARDAMPGGGRIVIETANRELDPHYAAQNPGVAAGHYVMLAVGDTGTGIPAELLGKVFEPFFTTKAVGKGTGLGLSMVYGFIRQSNGHIEIDSEVGRGTTIRLYLPRSDVPAEEDARDAKAMPRGSERILLAEDGEQVRAAVSAQLRSLGYTVSEAGDGQAALEILERGDAFDLLLTDVIMPALTGPQLVTLAAERWPAMKVIFMSAYSEGAAADLGRATPGARMLSKPFRKAELARSVRETLDGA